MARFVVFSLALNDIFLFMTAVWLAESLKTAELLFWPFGKKWKRLFPFIRKTLWQSLSCWQTWEKPSVPLR